MWAAPLNGRIVWPGAQSVEVLDSTSRDHAEAGDIWVYFCVLRTFFLQVSVK